MRSVGTGSYLSAHAFATAKDKLIFRAAIEGLDADADPVAALGAATKQYADNKFVELAGDTMTGFLTLNADPVSPLHAATMQYVDTEVALAASSALKPDPVTVGSPTAPKYYFSTGTPSGGNDGDVWFQYTP